MDPHTIYVANGRQNTGHQLYAMPLQKAAELFPRGWVPQLDYQEGQVNVVTGRRTHQHHMERLLAGDLEVMVDGTPVPAEHINLLQYGSTATQDYCIK